MPMALASDGSQSAIPGTPFGKTNSRTASWKAGIITRSMMHRRASDSYFGH
jgi:hypothetical protein